MKCPRCQQDNPSHANFCLECGLSFTPFGISDPPSTSDTKDLQRALTEALDQQAATAEILGIISSSPADAQPVFDAIAVNALRLCDAKGAVVVRYDGGLLHVVAHHNVNPEAVDRLKRQYPMAPDRHFPIGRAVLDGAVVQVTDLQTAMEFSGTVAREFGARGHVSIPLVHGGRAIGAIGISRPTLGPFSDRQIALLQAFAAQAVIAIENVRLFNETKEALERQTATGEILRVISTSPTDLTPVLESVARNAARLCEADDVSIIKAEDDGLTILFSLGPTSAFRGQRFPAIQSVTGQAIEERRTVHVRDLLADPSYEIRPEFQHFGWRSALAVPLLRDGVAIGTITARRSEVRPFSDQQITLLETFADQAVIAIENVRLFTELQAKNQALTAAHAQVTEALQHQTATSEILQVISRSPTDVQPVFDTIIRSAVRLLGGFSGLVTQIIGDHVHLAALTSTNPSGDAAQKALWPRPVKEDVSVHGQVITALAPYFIIDVESDRSVPPSELAVARARGWRSIVAVPLLRDGRAIGSLAVTRSAPGAFADGQVALLQTFADQAVIAIENVRLFKELEARTSDLTRSVEQLTALGEVGRAVSSTLDLETVLSTIVSRAVELSRADGGSMYEYDEAAEEFSLRASYRLDDPDLALRREIRIRKGEGAVGQLAVSREPVQIPDITTQGAYDSRLRAALLRAGARAVVAVPLLREEHLIGGLVVSRNTPGEFPSEAVELLRTFATQSALAIQNARLFREIEQKSRELEVASQHKSEFLANMSHELRTPLNAVIGFSEVLTERMFGELNEKQDEYLKDIHASGQHLLSLINDILDLSKIEAGKMELELSDFDLPMTIDNALMLVRERAARRGIEVRRTVDERLGQIQADERKIRQVLLNLLSNAIKFTPESGRIDVEARSVNESVEVSVTDTGVGIAPEDQEAVFEEFRQVGTADKKVEGTGLGLALSRKFIELHGGKIWVTSQVGTGSTFAFTVPVRQDQ